MSDTNLTELEKKSIVFNGQQNAALKAMHDFVSQDDKSLYLLKGYAGTGKTTVIQEFAKHYKGHIAFTAWTNKAVKVLRKMALDNGLNGVPCLTLCQLLGLTLKSQGDSQILVDSPIANTALHDYSIIVVDECSMIDQQLFAKIIKAIRFATSKKKFIFMGDPLQLPPIGEDKSLTFEIVDCSVLTQVMRQKEDNPIIGLCTDLREIYESGIIRLPAIVDMVDRTGTIGIGVMRGDRFYDWMPEAFELGGDFDKDADNVRVIAWRNDTVQAINSYIHAIRYPQCKTWLAEGEKITFNDVLTAGALVHNPFGIKADDVIVGTDMEGVVLRCMPTTHMKLDCHVITVKIDDTGQEFEFYALDDIGAKVRAAVKNRIAAENRKNMANGKKHLVNWLPYYRLGYAFAKIRPAYCITAHKAQGSTYKNVFSDAVDIWANWKKLEALQCLYVAASRATDNLIINI